MNTKKKFERPHFLSTTLLCGVCRLKCTLYICIMSAKTRVAEHITVSFDTMEEASLIYNEIRSNYT